VQVSLFYQPEKGYRYNSDTLFLYDFVSKLNLRGKILDVGSGSGILGVLLSRDFPKLELYSVEKQQFFHKLTLKNSEVNFVNNKNIHIDFSETTYLQEFDYIVSNPPFYHSNVIQSENSNLNIARYNHHLPLDKFIKRVSQSLKPRGYFLFCYDAKQFQEISHLLTENKLNIERIRYVHPSIDKGASLIMIQSRKGSKSSMSVEKPLINFSDEVSDIYRKANTYTLTLRGEIESIFLNQ
jgi:tRNA1(Val) A37 N6-methylase TrmN6